MTYKIAKRGWSILFIAILGCITQGRAQIVISSPNLGFTQACANDSFNSYSTTFVFTPEDQLQGSNQFIIELSDAIGDFSEAVAVFSSAPGAVTTSPATLNFELPTNTGGENYKIRIKSTAPAATSSGSDPFAAYYKVQDSPFSINNLIETAAFCAGGSYLLSIDNAGTGNNDSPLNYPELTFLWFKETSPTTAEFVDEGPTLSVSEEGTYFVETNYGSCTSDSFSNRVTVSEVTSGESQAGISSSLGNPFCPSQGTTTLSTIGALGYQWFKDGVPIPDATEQMYEASESGNYAVQVDLGDCSASGFIELQSELFDGELNVSQFNSIDEGESLFVEITTTANAPVYEWYKNGTLITGVTTSSYDVTEVGSYEIIVTETAGICNGSRSFVFEVSEPFPDVANIPNIISPNNDGINDTWIIPTQYVSGTDTQVMIMTNRGKVVLNTNEYQNNWPIEAIENQDVNQLFFYVIKTPNNETRKGTITVIN